MKNKMKYIFNNIENFIKEKSKTPLNVKLFGSNVKGLSLANSNINICIFNENKNNKKN